MSVFRRIMLGGVIDIDALPDTQKIYYKATSKVAPKRNSLGVSVIANKWDATTCEGIIVCASDIIKIGEDAFYNCSNLTSVTIPDSVKSIGHDAFYNCTSLKSIIIPESVTEIEIGAFLSCSTLKSIIIPNSVTNIGYDAFFGCGSLASVTIPNSVTTIGSYAFQDCRNITSVYISDIAAWCNISFTTERSNPLCYGASLYLNNELVTDLIIPDNVTTIGNNAFFGCGSLASVTIPNSVTSIGGAFYGCDSLASVYCKATTPPALDSKYAFLYNGSGRKIYVPAESVNAYKSATNWSEYADVIIGYDFENNTVIE